MKQVISSAAAPKAIGTYSQAIKSGNTVYISGQIPLIPDSMQMESRSFANQIERVLSNLLGVAEVTGANLSHIVKLTIYLTDITSFPELNRVMENYFTDPYPARTVVEVSALPKNAAIAMDAVLALGE